MATNDSLPTGHYHSDFLVPSAKSQTQTVTLAPDFMANNASVAMSSHSGPSDTMQPAFGMAPDVTQQNLQLESLFRETNSMADFQSISAVVSDSGSQALSYNQVTQQANDCSFPMNNNQSVPGPDPQTLSLTSQSSLTQSDFLSHSHQNPAQIASSQETMSINAMSQMTENELLWVINPSTFDPCV